MSVVLVLNAGSSSLKFRLSRFESSRAAGHEILRGVIDRIGVAGGQTATIHDHGEAVRRVIERLRATPDPSRVDAVGHRVVHGGRRFVRPTMIDAEVVAAIEALEDLAPLHIRPSLAAIRACRGGDHRARYVGGAL
jgi:acetate kinase